MQVIWVRKQVEFLIFRNYLLPPHARSPDSARAAVIPAQRLRRHPEVQVSSASLEGWHHGVRPSFEARKSAHLRMTESV
jgi:hypothetical protein